MVDSQDPMSNLAYFCEWGGPRWIAMVRYAFTSVFGTDLTGMRVLEIGFRYGRMSSLFALLGAEVVAIDVNPSCLRRAEEEAMKWGVRTSVEFVIYGGDIEELDIGAFDIAFSKSVLVVVPHLAQLLAGVNSRLTPHGKFAFIENGEGPFFMNGLRTIRHRKWDFSNAHFFKRSDLKVFDKALSVGVVRINTFPPILLIAGTKKATCDTDTNTGSF